MVASALFCLPGANELGHEGENPVHSAHAAVHEVTGMDLQKPMIPFVLLQIPVPEQLIHIFLFLHQVLTKLSLLRF